ncbi:helix-turn-helix domain-containing protein [Proteiniphilum propionicum]|uniref:helix-turn-helix domain-containing protein n=1 Tax=Proteiniphilum propionicum TaxID=2829812 RepID=UPI001EEA3D7F|nr:helix-turn-helix domain-containing protein [Proteiniphilum propionicum]ULB35752.1 helix-turn-helix domain-containing protein [Proteiniphilum propionicum]
MEVITFDSEAYKKLIDKIDRIASFVIKAEQSKTKDSANDIWMDSNEVAELLRISTRTLQRLRKENIINYSMLRGRCLYRLSEIERCLDERIIKSDPVTVEDFKRNYSLKVRG